MAPADLNAHVGEQRWPTAEIGVVRLPTVATAPLPLLFKSLGLPSHVGTDFRDPRRLFLESRELLSGEHQVGRQQRLARLASCNSPVEDCEATGWAFEFG
jgi:hypothetical protein